MMSPYPIRVEPPVAKERGPGKVVAAVVVVHVSEKVGGVTAGLLELLAQRRGVLVHERVKTGGHHPERLRAVPPRRHVVVAIGALRVDESGPIRGCLVLSKDLAAAVHEERQRRVLVTRIESRVLDVRIDAAVAIHAAGFAGHEVSNLRERLDRFPALRVGQRASRGLLSDRLALGERGHQNQRHEERGGGWRLDPEHSSGHGDRRQEYARGGRPGRINTQTAR